MKTRARQIFADQYDVLMACGALPDTGTLRAYAIALEEMEEAQAVHASRG